MSEIPGTIVEFQTHDVDFLVAREIALVLNRCHTCDRPQAILLAGQPGAGKTELSTMMIARLNGDAAFINGDDYRRYHPNYRRLYEEYGSDCVEMTQPFSSAVTEQLVRKLSDHKLNLVIEGTGRTVEMPRSTAGQLAEKGYTVSMAVIAARPEVSLTSTLLRFYQMNEGGTIPRATALAAHDNVVDVLPHNLDTFLSLPCISRISIWDRELSCLFDSKSSSRQPSGVLLEYWSRPWGADELNEAFTQLELLRQKEKAANLGQGAALDALAKRLSLAAQAME